MPLADLKLKRVTARISIQHFERKRQKAEEEEKLQFSKHTSWIFQSIFLLLGSFSK